MMTKFGLLLFGEASESRTDTGTDLRKKHLTGKPVDDIILSQSNKQSGSAKRIRGKFGENPSQPSLPYLSRKRALKSENLPDRCRKLPGMGSADRTLCLAPSRGARLRFLPESFWLCLLFRASFAGFRRRGFFCAVRPGKECKPHLSPGGERKKRIFAAVPSPATERKSERRREAEVL